MITWNAYHNPQPFYDFCKITSSLDAGAGFWSDQTSLEVNNGINPRISNTGIQNDGSERWGYCNVGDETREWSFNFLQRTMRYQQESVAEQMVGTFRLFSLPSMSLLLSCSSDIWPATAARSFWNVERKDSRLSSRETLVFQAVHQKILFT